MKKPTSLQWQDLRKKPNWERFTRNAIKKLSNGAVRRNQRQSIIVNCIIKAGEFVVAQATMSTYTNNNQILDIEVISIEEFKC